MANYFAKYPTTYYNVDDTSGLNTVTSITNRLGINSDILNNVSLFHNYYIKDGDTPENLAHQFYGDSEKHWVILMANNVIDPQFDWPLDTRSFDKFVEAKYLPRANTANGQTGMVWSNKNIESYYRVEDKMISSVGVRNLDYFQIDANTYSSLNVENESYTKILSDGEVLTLTVSKTYRTYYEYELLINENKRKIKIIDKEYIPKLMEELKSIFK